MKKMIVAALTLALTLGLAACGGGASSGSSSGSEAASSGELSVSEASSAASASAAEAEEASDASSVSASAESKGGNAKGVVGDYDFNDPNTPGKEALPSQEELAAQIGDDQVIHVGYLAQNETLQFCINLSEALMDEAAKYGKKVEVDMIDARGLAPQQVSQAEDMAIRDVDVVIISPIDQDANAPCIDILTEKGIPVVLVNTFTTNSELATSFVGCDDKEAGVIEVQLMSDVLGGEGKINVMSGTHGDPANEKRIQGMNDELANHPGIEIVQEQAADWDRGKAMSLTEDWLMSGREFDGVIAMNDEMAVSCQLALNTAGRENIKVVGVDAIDEALKMIKDGTLYGTVFQDAETQGRGSLNVAVAIALGQEVEPNYIIPYEGVTADNVDNYMK